MNKSLSINLFLIDGSIDGIIKAESPNWTGQCLKFPTEKLIDVIQREEIISQVGVYFLFGEDKFYIGESESLDERLKSHVNDKSSRSKTDWWRYTIIFSSSNRFLTKAHIKYIENKLIEFSKTNIKFECVNDNNGTPSKLNDAAKNDADIYIEYIKNFVAILGFDIFNSLVKSDLSNDNLDESHLFFIEEKGVKAKGILLKSGGILVQEGSEAVSEIKETPSINETARKNRRKLVEKGILSIKQDKYIFISDFQFDSLSAASSVILGRSSNGKECWINQRNKKTFKQIEKERLEKLGEKDDREN